MKRVLLVGAAQGESSVAQTLGLAGCQVIVADPWASRPTSSDRVKAVIPVDLARRAMVFDSFSKATSMLGGLDALVFAAANDATSIPRDVVEGGGTVVSAWQRTILQLVNGSFYCTQAALRRMVPQGAGSVVYLCADRAVDGSVKDMGLAAANTGILALSSSLAASAFRHGVTMNAVVLGEPLASAPEVSSSPDDPGEEVLAYTTKAAHHVMRTQVIRNLYERTGIGWAESVAALVGYLCSDAGALVTGSTLRLTSLGKQPPLIRWSY